MKSTVTFIETYSNWVYREEIEVDIKNDAWLAAYALADKWGFRPMKTHTTTVGNHHFVTFYGSRTHLYQKHFPRAL